MNLLYNLVSPRDTIGVTVTMPSEQPGYQQADSPQPSDAELFLLLTSGQSEALGSLYDRHAGLVYGIALQLLGNSPEAEDLTQDIFLILSRPDCAYNPKRGTLRTFLAILTRSRAIDRLRARHRRTERLKTYASSDTVETPADPLVEQIAQRERSQYVQAALAQLPETEQQVLRMAYYDGLSQSQISEQLDVALGTVKSRSRRGLTKLRLALADFIGS